MTASECRSFLRGCRWVAALGLLAVVGLALALPDLNPGALFTASIPGFTALLLAGYFSRLLRQLSPEPVCPRPRSHPRSRR